MLNWQEPGRHQKRMMETLNIIFTQHPELLEFLFERDRPRLKHEAEVRLWQIIEDLDDMVANICTGFFFLFFLEKFDRIMLNKL